MVRWAKCVDFPQYEVSDAGDVRSLYWDLPKVMTQHRDRDGYLAVRLQRDGKGYTQTVHRLVCRAFHGDAPASCMEVAHIDGQRRNNSVENLKWCTHAENITDKKRHGTLLVGEKHPRSKLTASQVCAIFDARGQISGPKLAARFGVASSTIYDIWKERRWTDETRSGSARSAKARPDAQTPPEGTS